MSLALTALILLAEGAEETEFVATVDVLRRANIDVVIAGLGSAGCIECSRGVKICADVALSDAVIEKSYNVVILPGGLGGMKKLSESNLVKKLLTKQDRSNSFIAAICAAPVALKTHGIAKNKALTSYPSFKDELVNSGYKYREDKVVVDGNLITSQGPGTVFDFALTIVEQVINSNARTIIANQLLL